MTSDRSPDGYYYRYDPTAAPGHRIARRTREDQPWGQGMPTFSLQHMSAAELRFLADLIDRSRMEVVR